MDSVLALDCSDRACSVAVKENGRLYELFTDQPRQQARSILAMIDGCLSEAQLSKSDLREILWCSGPGSFTGLRIAAACVQGLAYGLGLPVSSLSSLQALALRAPATAQRIWVGVDARMGQIYCAAYQRSEPGALPQMVVADSLLDIQGFSLPPDQDIYLGSALTLPELGSQLSSSTLVDADAQIHAGDLLSLPEDFLAALVRYPATQVEPSYLRKADAWKKLDQQG